ncbi:fluoride efflux transporter FluC [Microbacterium sp.]|uniref:fluoride efflux transporter FluC n=1 Tax=Microbacterium sp. TaxID=51671 RepID=UPI003F710148
MTPLLFLAVALAGGVGAGLRYLVDVRTSLAVGARFPWGILVVNISGSFALGVVAGSAPGTPLAWIVGVGLLGGYTTFSSVAVTTVVLAEEPQPRAAVANAVGTLVATIAAAGLGLLLGGAL